MADSSPAASPESILLDRTAYIADDRQNGTTAVGFSFAGHAVEVSFRLADPPAPSHLCVCFPGGREAVGRVEAAVVCSEKDMAVVELRYPGQGRREYFVYKADPKHPSLDRLPSMCFETHELGLLPGAGGYHIAALHVPPPLSSSAPPPFPLWPRPEAPEPDYYHLFVLSSKTRSWSTTAVRSPWLRPSSNHHVGGEAEPPHQTHKVISLGGSTLGFVDFRRGILCYDVLGGSPEPRHIPFPPPLGSNRMLVERCAESIRDVACINGVIKFVEVENLRRLVVVRAIKKAIPDVLHDSDLEKLSAASSRTGNARYALDDDGTMDSFSWANDGWRVVTWSRQLSNSDHWIKGCDACADDIVIGNPGHPGLLPPELMGTNNGGSGSEATLTKNYKAGAPALSVHDGDVVYLMCKLDLERKDQTGWLLGIDTRRKRVEHVASVSTGRAAAFSARPPPGPYIPCAISKHMSLSPHVCKGSDCCKDVEDERDDASVSVPTTLYPGESHVTPRNSALLFTPAFFPSRYFYTPFS